MSRNGLATGSAGHGSTLVAGRTQTASPFSSPSAMRMGSVKSCPARSTTTAMASRSTRSTTPTSFAETNVAAEKATSAASHVGSITGFSGNAAIRTETATTAATTAACYGFLRYAVRYAEPLAPIAWSIRRSRVHAGVVLNRTSGTT